MSLWHQHLKGKSTQNISSEYVLCTFISLNAFNCLSNMRPPFECCHFFCLTPNDAYLYVSLATQTLGAFSLFFLSWPSGPCAQNKNTVELFSVLLPLKYGINCLKSSKTWENSNTLKIWASFWKENRTKPTINLHLSGFLKKKHFCCPALV